MLALLLIFVGAKLLSEIFERLRQPGIAGEIIAGILIGPHVLGWVDHSRAIDLLGQAGVILLLFRVGLEVKASELRSIGGRAALIAMFGVVVPFLTGWSLSALWGFATLESVFIGAAMVATSVGITAQVLAAGGWLGERASKLILAAAVIDDVLGLMVLAAVSTLAGRSVTLAEFGATAGILGAFLLGVALADMATPRVHALAHRSTWLLVPFFLAGVGLNFDVTALANASSLLFACLVLVGAVASKWMGCGLAALPLGRADAMRIGVGMIPRGEIGMVVAQIGLGFGVLQPGVYGTVVFMSVATTLLAPPLLRLTYRGAKAAAADESYRLD